MIRRVVIGWLALALLTSSCGGGDRQELMVLAASSLQGSLDQIASQWTETSGVTVSINYAGSQSLAAQLRDGFRADVAIVANRLILDQLTENGIIVTAPHLVVTSSVVLAFAEGVTPVSLSNIADSGLVVVLADPAVPLGGYSVEVLAAAGISMADLDPASLEVSAAGVVTRLRSGDADASLIYAVNGAEFVTQSLAGPSAEYLAAPIAGSREDAMDFIEHLTSVEARLVWDAAGFEQP